jgi:hypothetical protein
VDDFLETVEGSWSAGPFIANPFKRVAATTKPLTKWNERFIGSNKEQIMVANELILRLDIEMESRPLSPKERGFRKLLKHKLIGLALLERAIARQ